MTSESLDGKIQIPNFLEFIVWRKALGYNSLAYSLMSSTSETF